VSQDEAIILAFKVVEVASVVTITAFIACYSRWAKWWANPIGRTIVYKDISLILVLLPSILSIFFSFNRLTSHIAAWFDVGAFALVPVIMCWRIVVFRKIHKAGELSRNGDEDGGH
jgi:glucan phosphoethanolaminetransferase (alkaline phosphatase superfamily)